MRPKTVWRYPLKGRRNVTARRPVVGKGAVYVVFNYGDDSVLTCCDAASGSLRWEVPVGFCGNSPVLGADGEVYVTNFEGAVYAIGPDGGQLWRIKVTDHNIWAPLLPDAEHLVVAETHVASGHTWCLDPRDGEVRWTFDSGGPSYELAGSDGRVLHSTVLPDDRGTRLHCLSLASGEPLWAIDGKDWLLTPRVIDDVVYVGARRSVHAYALDSGAPLSRLSIPGRSREPADAETMVASAGRLYFGDTLGGFHAASVATTAAGFAMKRLWSTSFGIHELRFAARAVLLAEMVVCLYADGELYGLDAATGTEQWRVSLRTGPAAGGVATDGESVFVAHGRELRRVTVE